MAVFSIIQKSQLEGALRLDAEYYQPEFLEVEKKLNFIKTTTIENISESVVNFGAYSLCNYIQWEDSGVPYLNVQDIKEGYIDFSDTKFISEKVNKILNKSQVKEGQVILTIAGTIGNVAVAHNIPKQVNSNQATAKITLKENFSPYFVAAFFNSYYGKNQITREIVSSVQPNIFLFQIKNFKIPVITERKQKEIENIYKQGLNELENSKNLNRQTEELLLKELKLDGVRDRQCFTVKLSEVRGMARMDAEYFQPKYFEFIKHIKNNCRGIKLGELVSMKKGFEPGAEEYRKEGKLFIRVSSLSKFGVNMTEEKYLSEEMYNKLKDDFEPKQGEILLTKDASIGVAYVLKEKIEGIVSGGVLRLKLKTKDVEDEYLAFCLNSIVGQMQAERDAGGSVIAHWKPEQIKNAIIPILPKEIQKKITLLIRDSFTARAKAKELLEDAKKKVEEMIENKN